MTNKTREQECHEFILELSKGLDPLKERMIVSYPDEATVQTDETGKKLNSGFWPKHWKEGKHIQGNCNAYVCISSCIQTPNPRTGDMRFWRGESGFAKGHGFFVDDVGNGTGSKGDMSLDWLKAKLSPTAIVETSPNNYQCWYFFDEVVYDMAYYKAFLYCFVESVLEGAGGDVTIKDVCRYGRLPIGYNNKRLPDGSLKYPDDNGNPFKVRLVEANYSHRYDPQVIAEAFGFEIVQRRARLVADFDKEEFKYDYVHLQMAVKYLNELGAGEGSNGEVVANQSGKYRIRCPWGHEHSNGDPYGAYFRGPVPGAEFEFVFGCAHDACRKVNKRTWSAFVDAIVMPQIIGELDYLNMASSGMNKRDKK